jgi:hypothetical protein
MARCVEKPKPGSEGATTWKEVPPAASAYLGIAFTNRKLESGQPCSSNSGSAFESGDRW